MKYAVSRFVGAPRIGASGRAQLSPALVHGRFARLADDAQGAGR